MGSGYQDFDYQGSDPFPESIGQPKSKSTVTFLVVTLLLTIFGLVQLYSASYNEALLNGVPHYYYVVRQLQFVGLAVLGSVIIVLLPSKILKALAWPLALGALALLLLTAFTPFGQEKFGSRRWLRIGALPALQPSEFAKLALILLFAAYQGQRRKVLLPAVMAFSYAALVFLQRDYSTMLLIVVITVSMVLYSGVRLSKVVTLLLFLFPPLFAALFSQAYRIRRVASFFFPALDPSGMNYQVNISLKAIAGGKLFGVGLGKGTYKLGLLPEVHSDFIIASVAEELGFLGILFILLLFFLYALIGYNGSRRLVGRDPFLSALGFGSVTMVLSQAILNLAVITSLAPPTGIPMPFFSQGGTNMFVVLIASALILHVLKHANRREESG
ncbi:MAG: FtsW/RodA/SpoVE family cell cycle protein [Spirochaetales bacterium]|nr:FtsW/RodA/SpoVE family cell cycle protein [Spirochaetales bacterium]